MAIVKKVVTTLRRMPDELIIPGGGEKARLTGTGVMEYCCESCGEIWWMKTNASTVCPCCMERLDTGRVTSRWTTPQTAFIPQQETKVTSNGYGDKNDNHK